MAQATLDPAAVDAPPGAESSKTDELLAKMVGEEVDKLLAEAEAIRAAAAPAATIPPTAPTPAVPAVPAVPAAAMPAVPEAAVAPAVASTEVLPTDVAGLDPAKIAAEDSEIAKQLDDLIQGMDEPAALPPAAEAPAPTPVLAEAPVAEPVAADPAVVEEARLQTLATELEVDQPAAAQPAADVPAVSAEAPKAEPVAKEAVYRIPLLLRPLVWLNSPLEECSDRTRSLMGKAAILTIVNSAGLIAYVALFRKHH